MSSTDWETLYVIVGSSAAALTGATIALGAGFDLHDLLTRFRAERAE